MDVVALSKFQFAFTVMYHFFFVPISIGLGLVTVLFERKYYKSGDPADRAMSELWIKIFAATFAIGVATGVTMEFAFGTNWATYSRFVGDIFGAPLAAEGLFAFFLESTFLGVLIFGRNKVSKKFYYVSTWLVWLGSLLSALWIIIANSWMQTPTGFKVEDGKAVLTNFFAAGFNPSTLPRYAHTINAVLITGGMMCVAIGAHHLLKGTHKEFGRRSVSYGIVIALVGSLAMAATGHFQAVEVMNYQPVKMAAMEGHWETGPMPLGLVGFVDVANQKTVAIEIPGGASFLDSFTFTKSFPGLKEIPADVQPPIQVTYQSYHFMIVVFLMLVLVTLWVWWINRTGKLEQHKGLLRFLVWAWLLPELGIQLGWMAAEIGRQPWIVSPSPAIGFAGLRTVDAISKVVPAGQLLLTIVLFFTIYAVLFVGWARVVLNIIKKGPSVAAASSSASA